MRARLLLFFLILTSLASARQWYDPIHDGPRYVNANLSLRRASRHPDPRWEGQLVLWSGRLRQVQHQGAGWRMKLETPDATIPVQCPRAVLTLKPDPREGCRVAIKGEVTYQSGQLGLVGRSIILLEPARSPVCRDRREFLSNWVRFHCPDEKPEYGNSVADAILQQSQANQLDPLLLAALLQIESAYRKDAVSSSGAIGLGQLMPFTAEGLGVNPWDPQQNVAGAAKMLSGLLQGWTGELDPRALALASYNAGPSLVRQLQTIPDIPETSNYVYFIGSVQKHLSQLAPAR